MAEHSICHPGYPLPHGESPYHHLILKFRFGEPEYEILRIPLVPVDIDPSSGLQLVEVQTGQFTVSFEGIDAEVDVSARHIGMALRFKTLDEFDHILDVLCGTAGHMGTQDIATHQYR